MDNFIVAFTNLAALQPIAVCISRCEWIDATLLFCTMFASIVYHLLENAKHNMTGIPRGCVSDASKLKQYELIALNADRVFAALVIARFMSTRYKKIDQRIFTLGMCSLGYMALSECQNVIDVAQYRVLGEKSYYMITHCMWHISAFYTAYLLVSV